MIFNSDILCHIYGDVISFHFNCGLIVSRNFEFLLGQKASLKILLLARAMKIKNGQERGYKLSSYIEGWSILFSIARHDFGSMFDYIPQREFFSSLKLAKFKPLYPMTFSDMQLCNWSVCLRFLVSFSCVRTLFLQFCKPLVSFSTNWNSRPPKKQNLQLCTNHLLKHCPILVNMSFSRASLGSDRRENGFSHDSLALLSS